MRIAFTPATEPHFHAIVSARCIATSEAGGARHRSCRRGFSGHARGVAHTIQLRLHALGDLGKFRLPAVVRRRLSELLDRQDQGTSLTAAERGEAEGLVELAEMRSLLKLRASGAQAAAGRPRESRAIAGG